MRPASFCVVMRSTNMSFLRTALIYVAAAWSGFFVMGVELLSGRLLAPYWGNGIFTWGAIIAAAMASLSIGYLAGGRISVRGPSIARLGKLMCLAAISTWPIIALGDYALEWLSLLIPDPRYGSLVGSLGLFGIPMFVSGMVSPYAVRLLIADLDHSGEAAGGLYFVSTLGSALGTIVTSFWLVLYWEVNTIILGFIAISMSIGVLLMGWGAVRSTRTIAPAAGRA